MQLSLVFVVVVLACFTESRIVVKREVEREGQPKETVLVSEKNDGNDVETINGDTNGNDAKEVIEFDLDNRGVLSFGGHIPAFDMDNINERMNEMIATMLRRMHEMQRRVNETTSKYPDNYNNTNVEIVEIGGKQYRKETTITNRRIHGMTIYSKSTSLVPVDDDADNGSSENGDVEKVANRSSDRPKVTDKDDKKRDDSERES